MTSGEYYLKTDEKQFNLSESVDPNLLLHDKWDIFHKPTWDRWKEIINNS